MLEFVRGGTYVAFLDDDDEWLPDKVEKQIEYLHENSAVDGVSCLYTVQKGDEVVRTCQPYTGECLHRKVIERSVSVFTTTLLVKRAALDEAGYFDESLLRHQDLQLLLDFLLNHQIGVIQEYLAILHSDSEINHPDVEKMISIKKSFFQICDRHLRCYSDQERKNILAAHYFEIILAALRSKRFGIALKYLGKIGLNIPAYRSVFKRLQSRY